MYKPISKTHADERLSDNTHANYCAQCKNCKFWDGGDNFSNRYDKSSCRKYKYPECKPIEVINNKKPCVYRIEKR